MGALFRLEHIGHSVWFACGCWLGARPGEHVTILSACAVHAALIRDEVPPAPAAVPRCEVHGKLLACPACQGARGGRAVTPRKLEQLRAAAKRPRKRSQPAAKQSQPAAKQKDA